MVLFSLKVILIPLVEGPQKFVIVSSKKQQGCSTSVSVVAQICWDLHEKWQSVLMCHLQKCAEWRSQQVNSVHAQIIALDLGWVHSPMKVNAIKRKLISGALSSLNICREAACHQFCLCPFLLMNKACVAWICVTYFGATCLCMLWSSAWAVWHTHTNKIALPPSGTSISG